jgi:hypothetical protein
MDNIAMKVPAHLGGEDRWELVRRAPSALAACKRATMSDIPLMPCRNVNTAMLLRMTADSPRELMADALMRFPVGTQRAHCTACHAECWLPPKYPGTALTPICWICIGALTMMTRPLINVQFIEVTP